MDSADFLCLCLLHIILAPVQVPGSIWILIAQSAEKTGKFTLAIVKLIYLWSLGIIRGHWTLQYTPSSKYHSNYEPKATIMSITWDFIRDILSATLGLEVNNIP